MSVHVSVYFQSWLNLFRCKIETIRFQADFEGLYKDHQSIQPSNLVDVEILFEFMRWALTFALQEERSRVEIVAHRLLKTSDRTRNPTSDPFVALHGVLCDCVN